MSALSTVVCKAQLTFSGNVLPPVSDTPEASSGLSAIYVIDGTAGVTASYTAASSTTPVKWMKFSSLGGGYAQEVASTQTGNVSSVTLSGDDMGYIVEEGTSRKCYWIVNYANHRCDMRGLSIAPEQDCMSASLTFSGSADRITYYTVNGVPRTLSRGMTLEYSNLAYNEERGVYEQSVTTQELEYLSGEIHVASPLCQTDFLLTGDRFQIAWGGGKTISSPVFEPKAVEAVTSAVQTSRTVDNEQKSSDTSSGALGGSAPVEITFSAVVTDAAIYHEWQYAADPQFDVIDMRVNAVESTRVFNEYGTVYVRFVAGDASGDCEWISETYTVNIGESKLECPNAFSPGASEGSNDEWKVSYKSIVSFDCHIFNRWGIEVAHLTDPSQGWDGRHNGKLVKSGVFYYVIQAEGADGKRYKLSGDINIIHANYNKGY
ncbi:MAG: gliding motility-associated C-terminal domain-containing protein [Muribaculaceae bacterium]|nr:gliding motility-associated C-terminal domain-containing protein [Muribaculaceae bacterium]